MCQTLVIATILRGLRWLSFQKLLFAGYCLEFEAIEIKPCKDLLYAENESIFVC